MTQQHEDRAGAVYTHGHHASVLRSHRSRTIANSAAYLEPHLRPGLSLLDVGCGPATITVEFAARLGGSVTATEVEEEALALGRAEAERQGIDSIDFRVADVHALPFADHSFDIVHAHQVLQHVGDPVLALSEMRRVCRPDGLVAARDADYAAFTWFPESPALTEWLRLYRRAAVRNGGEPDAGRRMLAWARAAGFSRMQAGASTWCHADPDSRHGWGDMWADRILESALARQLVADGDATREQLEEISAAWRAWADDPDGWFSLLHGEILARP